MTTSEIPAFNTCHVTVVGDVMLDRYWFGQTGRISPEAPVPVVHIQNQEARPGGAGNVAINLSHLGCHTHLFGAHGNDEAGLALREQLNLANIDSHFCISENHPTCTKLRVISRNQQLMRLDFEQIPEHGLKPRDFPQFENVLSNSQALILSDYGKGTIANAGDWIKAARQQQIPVFVDPKGHDFARYRGASILTPNFKEFQLVVGVCKDDSSIIEKAMNAIKNEDLDGILITRGKVGMMLVTKDGRAQSFPAMALEVFDVTGAGDTVIATLSASVAAGKDYAKAAELANYAAGCVVAKLGAATVTPEELASKVAHHHAPLNTGMMTLDEAKIAVSLARSRNEKIVFTNGCFDILHAGHVHYLQQAKAFGDRLIIAVNDDDSVRRLKGEGRPINQVSQRMKILAALEVVDWVIPFSADTPLDVIKTLQPDVLVKGGDYQMNNIVGADFVQAHGGQIKVLDFVDGLSTTKTIETIFSRFENTEA